MSITCKDGIYTIEGYSKSIQSPFFYPSISSIHTNHDVHDYFKLIHKTGYPAFLVSAYDLYNRKDFIADINSAYKGGFLVLMDSGHYEAFWRKDKKWTFKKLKKILNNLDVDLCFSYDVYYEEKNKAEHIKETIKYAAMTGGAQKSGITIPIIHGTPENFPDVVKKVVQGINPEMIGITERELGSSLLERAKNLRSIRLELDKTRENIPIHLLGTGNPTSILVYFLCGADFFDALEWCKNVSNPKNGHLYHFVQMDLVDCNCSACKLKNLPYAVKVTSHNLIFYGNFTDEIRSAVLSKNVDKLLNKYLPQHIISEVKKLSLRK